MVKRLAIVLVWLAIWQVASLLVGNPILLSGPIEVAFTLARDLVTPAFYASIGFSFARIVVGFLAAFVLALVLGALGGRFQLLADVLAPAMQFIKSVPIVCFIVLLLIWFGSPLVSAIAVFLVALPAIYFSTLEALRSRDRQMAELLRVHRLSTGRTMLAFYWPTMLPFLLATSRVAVGMSWKSGIAAELIGLPLGSIGERIYQAKITLSSADLMAWTLTIVLISLACERLFLLFLTHSETWTWRAALPQPHPAPTPAPTPTPIHVRKLSKSFNNQPVLTNLSFEVAPGACLTLRGASGRGKTTLLTLLAGLQQPDAGSIEGVGTISMVFQEARLFEQRTAVENIMLFAGGRYTRDEIRELLSQLLPPEALTLPVAQLSGGMRRRVELCRAVATPSATLLLDEPFTGLDKDTLATACAFLARHLNARTLICATHTPLDPFETVALSTPNPPPLQTLTLL